MSKLPLSLAIGHYAHTNELVTGGVAPVGIDLNVLNLPFETGIMRFPRTYEYDVSELSLANFSALVAREKEPPIVGLPVFPSRVFRHSSIYINEAAGIASAADLKGRRIGIPQWSQTALVYVRGWLEHDAGVPLASVTWIQAGVNEAGRIDHVAAKPPAGVSLTPRPDASLNQMLVDGEIDAVISARPPDCFLAGTPGIKRLFADPRSVEEAYYKATGVFPIMHLVAIRRDVYEKNRWIVRSLYDAFEKAKDIALARIANIQFSHLPMPWGADTVARARELAGGDPFPYGIEANRATLEPFLAYCHEQGVTSRLLVPDELFAPEIRFEMKV